MTTYYSSANLTIFVASVKAQIYTVLATTVLILSSIDLDCSTSFSFLVNKVIASFVAKTGVVAFLETTTGIPPMFLLDH